MRERRDCFCMPCSGIGVELAWMLTAMPLKQGIVQDYGSGEDSSGDVVGESRARDLAVEVFAVSLVERRHPGLRISYAAVDGEGEKSSDTDRRRRRQRR